MGQKKYKYLLWDLDENLLDSMTGVTSALKYALSHFNIEVFDPEKLKPMIGPPLQESFREVYGFSPEQITIACELYDEYYRKKWSL